MNRQFFRRAGMSCCFTFYMMPYHGIHIILQGRTRIDFLQISEKRCNPLLSWCSTFGGRGAVTWKMLYNFVLNSSVVPFFHTTSLFFPLHAPITHYLTTRSEPVRSGHRHH